jgi:hypothetical protein
MTYQDSQVYRHQQAVADASAAAQATADARAADDALARSKGATPEHAAARQRVAALFCDTHLPAEPAAARAARLAKIDYASPVVTTNARGVDVSNPRAKGFLGIGRKPAYLLSEKYPPKGPDDPIYALEYLPAKG